MASAQFGPPLDNVQASLSNDAAMKHITFYFDVISPYAYLAFGRMPLALQGLSYCVNYQPVLLAGLLKHHGQLGTPMQLPMAHPFNPLALLRLAVASNPQGLPNRYVTETLFHHVWQGGQHAEDGLRLQTLTALLKPALDPNGQAVKTLLKSHTETAIEKGVFDVPTIEVDDKLFFGLDALPMLADYLKGRTRLRK